MGHRDALAPFSKVGRSLWNREAAVGQTFVAELIFSALSQVEILSSRRKFLVRALFRELETFGENLLLLIDKLNLVGGDFQLGDLISFWANIGGCQELFEISISAVVLEGGHPFLAPGNAIIILVTIPGVDLCRARDFKKPLKGLHIVPFHGEVLIHASRVGKQAIGAQVADGFRRFGRLRRLVVVKAMLIFPNRPD